MKIEQIIVDSLALTEKTKIPVLFFSNPGLGKTTILKRYAARKGYHLETIIGSRFSPEEISGYQVNNGGDHLVHMSPEWFSRITEKAKQGITTLLFIDEISTCPEAVQGALLTLIFDRTIGSEKFLPDDTVIVSAANYAQNLPPTMNIMAPTLNRFILINLNEDYSAMDMLNEFIDEYDEKSIAVYEKNNVTEDFVEQYRYNFKKIWKEIFVRYSDPKSSLGCLNVSNRNLAGIYESEEKYVYNFISGRTLSYLFRTLLAYYELGIENDVLFNKIVDGLVGNGTSSFKDVKQYDAFRGYVNYMMKCAIGQNGVKVHNVEIQNDIIKDIESYISNVESTGYFAVEDNVILSAICSEINKEFLPEKILLNLNTKENVSLFVSRMESILELYDYIRKDNVFCMDLRKIVIDYYGLYCDVCGINPDFKKFGKESLLYKTNYFAEKVRVKNGERFIRTGLRLMDNATRASLYRFDDNEDIFTAKLRNKINLDEELFVWFWENGSMHKLPVKDFLEKNISN